MWSHGGATSPRRDTAPAGSPLSRAIPDKLAATLRTRPWPLHPEHLRTTERQLLSWLRDGFELRRRTWIAGWLTREALKR
jgi:hypothetical protein